MAAGIRPQRMAEQILSILSDVLLRELADQRLKSLVLTRVRVSADLRVARVYYNSYLVDAESLAAAGQALERASSFLRRGLGRRLGTRYVPELRFFEDHSAEHAQHIDQVLADIQGAEGGESAPPAPIDDQEDD